MKIFFRKSFKRRIKINKNESKNPNVEIYPLTPTISINDNTYLDYLISALDKKNITNIALSGPYGSGKSSILKVLRKRLVNNDEYKFLNISLATFKDKEDKEDEAELTTEEYLAIEKSILQQMFYSVEQKEIPNSRFKRIKFDKYSSIKSFLLTIWILSIIELFSPHTFIYHYIKSFDFTNILAIIFSIGFIKFVQVIYKSTSNIKLSKFIIQNQEISLDNDKQISILNANIDEIIYFFNSTKYNVMIIEDLDRFKNLEIFTKLREINTLLNNRNNGRKITFIYAIKDDMFKNKDRTKFFDYIIPVVPFINSSNSSKKLIELFKKVNLLNETNDKNNKKVDEKFIKDISIHINDMRFLINVFNEFIQYTKKLRDDINLEYNCIFAISLYKNYKPDDFAKLHNDEGILYTLFSQKYKDLILIDITNDLNREIEDLTTKIDKINSLTVQTKEELRSLYIYHLMNYTKQTITHFNVDNNYVTINDFILNNFDEYFKTFKGIISFRSIQNHNYNSNITFKQLEDIVDEITTYEEKKAAIELKDSISIEELKKKKEDKQNELSKIKAKTLNELLNENKIDEKTIINKEYINSCLFGDKIEEDKKIDILKDDLLMYLLRYGHIKEDYFKYISYYHPGQETPTDINFILNIQKNRGSLPYDLKLTDFEYIFKELNSEDYFSKDAILNHSLVHTLLNKKEFVDGFTMVDLTDQNTKYSEIAINNIIKLLVSDMNKYFDFIDNYINKYDSSILEHNTLWASNFWEFIMINEDFSTERKDKYFYLIFEINEKNKSLNLLENIDKDNHLSQYIINKKSFNDFVNKIKNFKSFIEFLKAKGLSFKKLEDITYKSEKFNTIYENNLYTINFEWIEKILYYKSSDELKSKNYTSIINSGKTSLISYVHKNIGLYVKDVLLANQDLEDDEKDIIKLLNNKDLIEEYKTSIINRYKKQFNDISEIIDYSWEELLKNNKLTPTFKNLKACIENEVEKKCIQEYINLESNYSAIFTSNKYDENEIEDLGLESIIFDNENINIETFEAFLRSIKYKYEILAETLSHEFMQYMIELDKVETNPQNYQTLIDRDFTELAIKLIEKEPKQFIQDINSFDIADNEIYIRLIIGRRFNDEEKISLLNLFNISQLIKYDTDKSLIEVLYDLKVKYFEKLTNEVFKELINSDLSRKKKIELFIKYKFKDRAEVTEILLKINPNFEKLTQFVNGPITMSDEESNKRLLKKLDEINYISSFNSSKKDKLNVYTHKSEKEIIIE
ncbi:YobI family P-loop NTPase [Aliarcobacter butzleri]|uniref:YobI family P-loop NTPase n=1 Tax=Aliarcobacter butzleri TaxID=28197 RepID=UPI0012F9683F|nr:hypothetical protein [Aliarcobacter butzleri]